MVQPVDMDLVEGHSEQSLIELVYIKTANKVLGETLQDMEQAIIVSKAVLETLNLIQQEKNKIDVTSKGSMPAYDEGDFEDVASEFFGSPIIPFLRSDFDAGRIDDLRSQLSDQLDQLASLVPGLEDDPNSLLNKGRQVVTDMADPTAWVLDNYDKINDVQTSSAGQFQINLTLSLTAAQSLNDSQKENVRRILFIFEEYYKSAASVLSKITSIIERIAQNIGRV